MTAEVTEVEEGEEKAGSAGRLKELKDSIIPATWPVRVFVNAAVSCACIFRTKASFTGDTVK